MCKYWRFKQACGRLFWGSCEYPLPACVSENHRDLVNNRDHCSKCKLREEEANDKCGASCADSAS